MFSARWLRGFAITLSLTFLFLILAAQYEGWALPYTVLLGTPNAIFGTFLGIWMQSKEFNFKDQIGLVAKNTVHNVEIAKAEYAKGKDLADAAQEVARLRLRPIHSTGFALALALGPWPSPGKSWAPRPWATCWPPRSSPSSLSW